MFLHPSLYALATLHPTQRVNVIVQKTTSDDHLEKAAAALGGQVTANLWIINGFVAEMPAASLPALAAAVGVRWISPDGAVQATDSGANNVESTKAYIKTVGADQVWGANESLQGQGMGVAVMDSGVTQTGDFSNLVQVSSSVLALLSFNETDKNLTDDYGHGTHVADIIACNGANCGGRYIGIASQAGIYNQNGQSTTSGVLQATWWLILNHTSLNIRGVNISFGSGVAQSYPLDPVDAAVELLRMSSVVVVASVGNTGPGGSFTAPGNSPYAIAVDATRPASD